MKANVLNNFLKAKENGDYILPNGELEKNMRYTGGRNSNTLVLGAAGSGKTEGNVKPSVLSGAGGSSMVVSDTKGMLYNACRQPLEDMGYEVRQFDFVTPAGSVCHYDPLEYINTIDDVQKMSEIIVYLRITRENL